MSGNLDRSYAGKATEQIRQGGRFPSKRGDN